MTIQWHSIGVALIVHWSLRLESYLESEVTACRGSPEGHDSYQRLLTEVTNGGDERPRPNVIKPLRSTCRRRKSPNGAGGVHFNQ